MNAATTAHRRHLDLARGDQADPAAINIAPPISGSEAIWWTASVVPTAMAIPTMLT